MTILYFLEIHSDADKAMALSADNLRALSDAAAALPVISTLIYFTPVAGGNDPVLRDEHPPLLVIQAGFKNEKDFRQAHASVPMQELFAQLNKLAVDRLRLQQEVLVRQSYFQDSKKSSGEISYLVSYQRPAENEKAFLDYYCAHHPTILMTFPAIRRVELGLPVPFAVDKCTIPAADRMLHCEVSFDELADLNTALNSQIRLDLRKDYDRFPPFSGAVTHFAMHRQAIY